MTAFSLITYDHSVWNILRKFFSPFHYIYVLFLSGLTISHLSTIFKISLKKIKKKKIKNYSTE